MALSHHHVHHFLFKLLIFSLETGCSGLDFCSSPTSIWWKMVALAIIPVSWFHKRNSLTKMSRTL